MRIVCPKFDIGIRSDSGSISITCLHERIGVIRVYSKTWFNAFENMFRIELARRRGLRVESMEGNNQIKLHVFSLMNILVAVSDTNRHAELLNSNDNHNF